jgi:hypothetical protein
MGDAGAGEILTVGVALADLALVAVVAAFAGAFGAVVAGGAGDGEGNAAGAAALAGADGSVGAGPVPIWAQRMAGPSAATTKDAVRIRMVRMSTAPRYRFRKAKETSRHVKPLL